MADRVFFDDGPTFVPSMICGTATPGVVMISRDAADRADACAVV